MRHVRKKSEHDKHVIEAAIRRFGPVSQVGLHELTRLRRGTISSIVRRLLAEGKLVETGRSNNPLGRKQVLLQLNTEYGFIAGLEFDEEAVVAGVMDLHPRVRHIVREQTNLDAGRDGLIKQLQGCLRRAVEGAGIEQKSLVGIGIADPGLVDSRRGVTLTSSTIEFWKQVPLKTLFEQQFGIAAHIESKTRAKTIAERMLGSGAMEENLVYVDYGRGIGAGIIVDGKLLYGQNCGVGEFGHMHIVEDGRACKCGSIGCLEAIAGTAATESRLRKAHAEGAISHAVALAGGNPANVRAWHILSAAKAGDKISSNIVAAVGNYLGVGVANLVNLFNPSAVILDQRLELAGNMLLDQIDRIVRRQALASSAEKLALRFGTLGEEAGILGMGLVVLEKLFEIPFLRPPKFMVEANASTAVPSH